MNKIFMLLRIVLSVTLASVVYAQSLAEVAEREKERRSRITDARVISAEEAAKYRTEPDKSVPGGARTTDRANTKEAESGAETEAQSGKTNSDEPQDLFGRPESYWRKTMSEARQRVTDLENEKNVLTLKQNRLENEFHREDDGFRRQAIQREIQKTFYEQDLNRENLEKAKDALEDLEKEAKKSGALPGWVSEPRRSPRKK